MLLSEPELHQIIRAVLDGVIHDVPDERAVAGMNEVEEAGLGPIKAARLQPEDLFEFAAPPDGIRRDMTRPCTHRAAAHGERQDLLAFAERSFSCNSGGYIGEEK